METKELGHFFDLDGTQQAYKLGGVNIHWTDYTFEHTEEWDEDRYYKDFDMWWDDLKEEVRKEILYKMGE
jgi:hypothetical protein